MRHTLEDKALYIAFEAQREGGHSHPETSWTWEAARLSILRSTGWKSGERFVVSFVASMTIPVLANFSAKP
jgi:hypothetical protein